MNVFARLAATLGLAALTATAAFAQMAPTAGTHVKGYTRTTKSGKTVTVKGYNRMAKPMPGTAVKGYTRTMKNGKTVAVKGYTRKAPMKGMMKGSTPMAPKSTM